MSCVGTRRCLCKTASRFPPDADHFERSPAQLNRSGAGSKWRADRFVFSGRHPRLREVAVPRIGQQDDNGRPSMSPRPATGERRGDGRARRAADEQPFLAHQPPRHRERLLVGHALGRVDHATGRSTPAPRCRRCPRPGRPRRGPGGVGSTRWASREPTGSARTIRTPGQWRFRNRPTPVIVPPVPTPQTNAPTRPPHCARISGPVVASWIARVGRVGELVGQEPAALRGEPARRRSGSCPGDDGGAFGVTITSAPSAARADPLVGRHLLRHHAGQPVAADRRDEGQADAGVAGRRLDERHAGLEHAAHARRRRRWPAAMRSLTLPPGLRNSHLPKSGWRCTDSACLKRNQRSVADLIEKGAGVRQFHPFRCIALMRVHFEAVTSRRKGWHHNTLRKTEQNDTFYLTFQIRM